MQSQVVLEPCSAPLGWKSLERSQCALKSLPPSLSHWEKLFPGALGYWEKVREGSGCCGRVWIQLRCVGIWGYGWGISRNCGSSSISPFPPSPCPCLLTGPSGRARPPRTAGEPRGSGKNRSPSPQVGKRDGIQHQPRSPARNGSSNLRDPLGIGSRRLCCSKIFLETLPVSDPPVLTWLWQSQSCSRNLFGRVTPCLMFDIHPTVQFPQSHMGNTDIQAFPMALRESCSSEHPCFPPGPSLAAHSLCSSPELKGHFLAPHKTFWE